MHLLELDEGLQLRLSCWHGHGGSSRGAARQFRIHQHWPTVTVWSPRPSNPSKLVDPKGLRSGWQSDGDAKNVYFFDVMLEDLLRGIVDADLVFSTGHSNGWDSPTTCLLNVSDLQSHPLRPLPPSIDTVHFKIPVFHVRSERSTGQDGMATIDHLLRFYDCEPPLMDGLRLLERVEEGHIRDMSTKGRTRCRRCWALITGFFQSQPNWFVCADNTHPSNGDPKQDLERPSQHSMVYELRTYTAADGKLMRWSPASATTP